MTNKPLRIKDLIQVNFTIVVDKDDKRPLVAREVRYKCAVTGDILSNSTPVAVLRGRYVIALYNCRSPPQEKLKQKNEEK